MDAPQVSTDRITRAAPHVAEDARRSAARPAALLPFALLLGALLVRAVPWLANLPLHHDEALYGTWARAIADGSDPLLLIPWVDKPPLVLYLLALSIRLFGTSELALRVPGMIVGVLTVLATFGLSRRVAGERVAWVAALLVALSPFAILFAPTAFTDGWLTLFLVAAAWAALAQRPGWAGVSLGLACASKQQGVMGIALVLALIVVGTTRRLEREGAKGNEGRETRRVLGALGLALLGFAIVFGAVTYWDSLRWHNRPSYWDQSFRTYGGVVMAPFTDWAKRAGEWARQAGYWFGVWRVTAVVLVASAAGYVCTLGQSRGWFLFPHSTVVAQGRRRGPGVRAPSPVLLVYVLGYLFVHLALTFQPWDRYLLPILPLVCVLCAQGLVLGWDSLQGTRWTAARQWAGAALAAGLLYAAALGVTASIPVGSDIGAYRGVAEAAEFLSTQPAGTTVYYDEIGWHLGYYLHGRPITRSWYNSPSKLASETQRVAAEGPGAMQLLVLPAWEEGRLPELRKALAAKGFVALPAYEVARENGAVDLTVYRLETTALASGGKPVSDAGRTERNP